MADADAILRAHVDAVEHLLDRIQTDPDVAYLLGPGTEAWRRLCLASGRRRAEGGDRPLAAVVGAVERERSVPRTAEPPRVHVLRHLVDLLRLELSTHALARIDATHAAWIREQRERRAARTAPPETT